MTANMTSRNLDSTNQSGDALLAPISASSPTGGDLSFHLIFDQISDARRADDPLLAAGEWETEIKTADWRKTLTLCEQGLSTLSKDFQLLAHYIEALIHLNGVAGLSQGLFIAHQLVQRFGDSIHPQPEAGDQDLRIAKLEWLDQTCSQAVSQINLVGKHEPIISLLHWQHAQRRPTKTDADHDNSVDSDSHSVEQIDQLIAQAGVAWFREQKTILNAARTHVDALKTGLQSLMGDDAPRLAQLHNSTSQLLHFYQRALRQLGDESDVKSEEQAAPVVTSEQCSTVHLTEQHISNRQQAAAQLRQVAQFFRQNEPHSPVSYLINRAASWVDMPLEQWLSSVIKDDATLGGLKELLGVKSE